MEWLPLAILVFLVLARVLVNAFDRPEQTQTGGAAGQQP